jgi:putative ABC transport system ATP-binding protein
MIRFREELEFDAEGPILAMEDLCKSYQLGSNELRVLREINLAIERGEYVAIMGPSGSGKSTLLNMIGCLDRPTSGDYRLGGQSVSVLDDDDLSMIRGARIGFVFQSFNLIAQLNVVENIEIPMYYQGFSEYESAERAVELATMVGLGDRLGHRPSELSGGQQ